MPAGPCQAHLHVVPQFLHLLHEQVINGGPGSLEHWVIVEECWVLGLRVDAHHLGVVLVGGNLHILLECGDLKLAIVGAVPPGERVDSPVSQRQQQQQQVCHIKQTALGCSTLLMHGSATQGAVQ